MRGYFSLVLHAHLPFVRHPEHEKFLEENWLFEAITETYLPLLQLLESWQRDALGVSLTLSLTPTLCSMLRDPLLQQRYSNHLAGLIELAEKEIHRTQWEESFHSLALFYHQRLAGIREFYSVLNRDLVGAFGKFQESGWLEIITSSATHAVLPLLSPHGPSVRAQILVARDHYRSCFGRNPRGIWLPECAYADGIETVLQEAGLRWFITDAPGILHASPQPRYSLFAPIVTPNGLAVFGREPDSARQVWSRHEGYPGDTRYRDFYRDIGFDLDLDYVNPYLPAPAQRGFTGIKYYRITGRSPNKAVYEPGTALQVAAEHADHFLRARNQQLEKAAAILDRPPIVVSPFDAELFGHWWYEGPEFLDRFMRTACCENGALHLITPEEYLGRHPVNQVATPAPSSWGEDGYWRVWLNEKNKWMYLHLHVAQDRMTELARRFPEANSLQTRALRQAGRELLLAQASDWPFILNSGTSPEYARKRVTEHLLRFTALYEQLSEGQLNEPWLTEIENLDNIFPEIDYRYWR